MKTYSLTEGELPHAGTSIAHNRAGGKRQSHGNGTADSSSRAAGDASRLETSHQAMGRPEPNVSALWRQAASIGRHDAPGDRHALRACAGAAKAFSPSCKEETSAHPCKKQP